MSEPTLFDIEYPFASGASFSDCERYRWILWRGWDESLPPCVFIGLNPSTADATKPDPTITRCIGFSKSWGFGSYIMLNAFGYRATKPKVMKAAEDPNGADNDEAIKVVSQLAVAMDGMVVAAWGTNCSVQREKEVCEMAGVPIHCLELTKEKRPRHPLYVKAIRQPQLFWTPQNPIKLTGRRWMLDTRKRLLQFEGSTESILKIVDLD